MLIGGAGNDLHRTRLRFCCHRGTAATAADAAAAGNKRRRPQRRLSAHRHRMFVGGRGGIWPDRRTGGFMLTSGADFPRRFSDADFMIEFSGRIFGRRFVKMRMRMGMLFGVLMMVMMLLKVGFVGGELRERRWGRGVRRGGKERESKPSSK